MGEASEATGLHQLTLKKRIASGEIKSRRIKKNSTRAIVVDLDSIRSLQLTQYPAVSMRDAAPRIGVSIETLKALRASGVIPEDYRSAFPGSLTHEDVEAFAERVRNLGNNKRALNDPGVTTLDDAFATWTASPKEKAGLLARLLADPTTVIGKRQGRGAGRLQVADQLVSAHFEIARIDAAACLPVLKTAEHLGCTAAVVTWLKRGGHLKTKRQHGRQTPSLVSVNAFHKKYEALARIAKRLGVTAKSAYARIDFTGLDHVKVQTTQYTTIFVNRRHVNSIRAALAAGSR